MRDKEIFFLEGNPLSVEEMRSHRHFLRGANKRLMLLAKMFTTNLSCGVLFWVINIWLVLILIKETLFTFIWLMIDWIDWLIDWIWNNNNNCINRIKANAKFWKELVFVLCQDLIFKGNCDYNVAEWVSSHNIYVLRWEFSIFRFDNQVFIASVLVALIPMVGWGDSYYWK